MWRHTVKMFKELIFLVFILNFSLAYREYCSNRKSDKKCYCIHTADTNYMTAVKKADCSSINLKNVPASETLDKELLYLDVSLNNIERLVKDYAYTNPILTSFKLCHNNIMSIDPTYFNGVPDLEELDLSYNNLSAVDSDIFTPLTKLAKLNLANNFITKIPQLQKTKLVNVDFSYNNLTAFFNNPNVRFIEYFPPHVTDIKLDRVGLMEISNKFFDGFVKVTRISLADNNLNRIPVLPNTIEYLDLSGNVITQVTAHCLNYPALKELKLNRMASLVTINHYAFFNLRALDRISVTDNRNLETFTELAFGYLKDNKDFHIKSLSLARNGLKTLNETYQYFFVDIEEVDLSGNPWTCNCTLLWLMKYASYRTTINEGNLR